MAGENDKPCPCGHPIFVADEPWETTEPSGACERCKDHDAEGRLILRKGTPEGYAYEARKALAEKAAAEKVA